MDGGLKMNDKKARIERIKRQTENAITEQKKKCVDEMQRLKDLYFKRDKYNTKLEDELKWECVQ